MSMWCWVCCLCWCWRVSSETLLLFGLLLVVAVVAVVGCCCRCNRHSVAALAASSLWALAWLFSRNAASLASNVCSWLAPGMSLGWHVRSFIRLAPPNPWLPGLAGYMRKLWNWRHGGAWGTNRLDSPDSTDSLGRTHWNAAVAVGHKWMALAGRLAPAIHRPVGPHPIP